MKRLLQQNSTFLILSLILLIVLSGVIIYVPKGILHLLLQPEHTPFMDCAFRYYTIVGEWVPYLVVAGLMFYKAGWAVMLLASVTISGLVGQLFKHLIAAPRPITYFAEHWPGIELQLVDGVEMSRSLSFPSGHTISFFAMFLVLCMLIANIPSIKRGRICLLETVFYLLATMGGYSRIYLNQHFALDVWGGIVIGILTTLLLALSIEKLQQKPFFDWNLLCLRKKDKK